MLPDAEILCILVEALNSLELEGGFKIKLNHRKILDGIFALCGVPEEKTRTISSAVDKLDKSPWETVRKEMTTEKGLDEKVADRIGEYVKLKGMCRVHSHLASQLWSERWTFEGRGLQKNEITCKSSNDVCGANKLINQLVLYSSCLHLVSHFSLFSSMGCFGLHSFIPWLGSD